jgi:PAS domain S-box-containing protein
MREFLAKLLTSDLMPHGYCYLWKPDIVWLHAVSDGLIALAYYLIPVALIYFVRKRRDVPFHWIFFMFGGFIFGCGTTHLMEVWTLWHGTYRLAGIIKALTAGASLGTAASLIPLVPRALALPSPTQLRAANRELEKQISDRRRAEDALQRAHDELELRVQQRTAELARTNDQLQAEIAERQRAEEVLRKQASLLDLSHDAIMVGGLDDTITYWSAGAQEMYGWTKEEVVGKVAHDFLGTLFPTTLERIKEEVIREGRWEGELTHLRRDGKQLVVASRWALQRDQELRPVAILQINTDVTKHKQAEEALQKAQTELAHGARLTMMGELAASIAHEVNQPLTAVVTHGEACLRWLASEAPNLDEVGRTLTKIVREGDRAGEVIRRIRSLLKKTPSQIAPLDINELIRGVLTLTHVELVRNAVSVETDLPSDLPTVLGDHIQLQQVILNLIVNAIEATSGMSEGLRQLVVASQRHGPDQVVVAVRDSGVGIDPDDLGHLFDAFFTTKSAGMGMGLSISRSIIEAHGGRLWATPNKGRGAIFQFSLPIGSQS